MARTRDRAGPLRRMLALVAVVVGLTALTAAACVLSYSSIARLRAAGRDLPRRWPGSTRCILDALLVMAGCSVLALRGAGLLSQVYGWLCLIVLLGALAAGGVVHEAGLSMPARAAEITAAVVALGARADRLRPAAWLLLRHAQANGQVRRGRDARIARGDRAAGARGRGRGLRRSSPPRWNT